jgi:hypothetical protein
MSVWNDALVDVAEAVRSENKTFEKKLSRWITVCRAEKMNSDLLKQLNDKSSGIRAFLYSVGWQY